MQHSFEPNKPLILPVSQITSVNGTPAGVDAEVTQHLSPYQRLTIEAPNAQAALFPIDRPCRIILDNNQMNIHVIVGMQHLFSSQHKIWLSPIVLPSLAVNPKTTLLSIQLAIANFPRFFGSTDQWIDDGHSSSRQGVAMLNEPPWTITITALPNITDAWNQIESTNGRSITHTASISRTDGSAFAAGDAYDLIGSLRSFLSFVSGKSVGIAYAVGTDQHGTQRLLRIGMDYTHPGVNVDSLFLTTRGSTDIPLMFSGFYGPLAEPNWHDDISKAIDCYVESNRTSVHTGLALTQTALEILSRYNLEKIGLVGIDDIRAENRIKTTLALSGIPCDIPCQLLHLTHLARKRHWTSGVQALVEVRNSLVHGNRKNDRYRNSMLAIAEMHDLSQWYVQMIILRMFNYKGDYSSRLARAGQSHVQSVPWA